MDVHGTTEELVDVHGTTEELVDVHGTTEPASDISMENGAEQQKRPRRQRTRVQLTIQQWVRRLGLPIVKMENVPELEAEGDVYHTIKSFNNLQDFMKELIPLLNFRGIVGC